MNYYLEEGFDALLPERAWLNPQERPGDSLLRLCAIRAVDREGQLRRTYPSSGEIVVELEFELNRINRRLCIGFALLNRDGVTIFQSCHTDGREKSWPSLQVGYNRLRCTIPAALLSYGKYYVAPRAYLHSVDWVLNGDPEVAFDVNLDHGVSPMWASVVPSHFPGGALTRVGKSIWTRREGRGLLWLLNPVQFSGVAVILLAIDLATFVGWTEAIWSRSPNQPLANVKPTGIV